MAKKGSIKLRGRFPAGTEVRLVHVAGAHVMRPGPNDETVDTQTVDKDGNLEFSKGVEDGERYFAVAYPDGQYRDVRLTGRADADDGFLTGYEPMVAERVRLSDGSFVDEPPEQNQKEAVPGSTWAGQHQVPKGTLQRSDTPRGSAQVITDEERSRANKQWRKQEPTSPILETTPEDAGESSARTAEPRDETPAKSTKGSK